MWRPRNHWCRGDDGDDVVRGIAILWAGFMRLGVLGFIPVIGRLILWINYVLSAMGSAKFEELEVDVPVKL